MTQLPPNNDPQLPDDQQTQQLPAAPAYVTQDSQFAPPLPQYAPQPGQPGQPGFPGTPGYYQQPQSPKPPMNVLALVSFIGSFFVGLVGVILGHIALGQIKRTGESGRGFALAGTIIGYAQLVLGLIGIVMFFAFMGIFGTLASSSISGSLGQLDQLEQEFSDNGEFGSGSSPWDGTAEAPFCDALNNIDLSYADETHYYVDILDETDDPALQSLLQEQIDFLNEDIDALSEEDFNSYLDSRLEWSQTHSQLMTQCESL